MCTHVCVLPAPPLQALTIRALLSRYTLGNTPYSYDAPRAPRAAQTAAAADTEPAEDVVVAGSSRLRPWTPLTPLPTAASTPRPSVVTGVGRLRGLGYREGPTLAHSDAAAAMTTAAAMAAALSTAAWDQATMAGGEGTVPVDTPPQQPPQTPPQQPRRSIRGRLGSRDPALTTSNGVRGAVAALVLVAAAAALVVWAVRRCGTRRRQRKAAASSPPPLPPTLRVTTQRTAAAGGSNGGGGMGLGLASPPSTHSSGNGHGTVPGLRSRTPSSTPTT